MTKKVSKEFCGHQELSQKLGADFYFATPYHSWERGLNEPTNRLLRQFYIVFLRYGTAHALFLNRILHYFTA